MARRDRPFGPLSGIVSTRKPLTAYAAEEGMD